MTEVLGACVVDVATHGHGRDGLCCHLLGLGVAEVAEDGRDDFLAVDSALAAEDVRRAEVAVSELLRVRLLEGEGNLREPCEDRVLGLRFELQALSDFIRHP